MLETTKRIPRRETMMLSVLLVSALIYTGCGGVEAQGPTVEERLTVLEADLAEREQALAERSAALAEREQELAGQYQELAGRLEEAAEDRQSLLDRRPLGLYSTTTRIDQC